MALKRISIRVSEEDYEALKAMVEEEQKTSDPEMDLSRFLRRIIREFVRKET